MLSLLGTHVCVGIDDARLHRALAILWEPMVAADVKCSAPSIEILNEDGGWVVRDPAGSWPDAVSGWDVVLRTKSSISSVALQEREDLLVLHAAAASRGTETVLMIGTAGAGKTTLCADLVLDGWTYLGDDLAAISTSDHLLHPVPRPPAFKGHVHRLEHFAERWAPPKILGMRDGHFLLPPQVLGKVGTTPTRPTCLIFPRLTAGDEDCRRLRAADALKTALVEVHDPQPAGVSLLADLCRSLPAFELSYANSVEAKRMMANAAAQR